MIVHTNVRPPNFETVNPAGRDDPSTLRTRVPFADDLSVVPCVLGFPSRMGLRGGIGGPTPSTVLGKSTYGVSFFDGCAAWEREGSALPLDTESPRDPEGGGGGGLRKFQQSSTGVG